MIPSLLGDSFPGFPSHPEILRVAGALGFLILLAFYGWLAARSASNAALTKQPFGIADAICAGVLAVWMISIIWQSVGAPGVINLQAILVNSAVYVSLVMGVFGVMGFQGLSPVTAFRLQPFGFPKAALAGLVWLLVSSPLILAIQALVRNLSDDGNDSQLIVRYFLEHPHFKDRAAVIAMAVIVAPVAEEVLFRGYFYGVIRRFGGRVPAILISSLLFAAIHVHLPSFPGLAVLAMILCLLYERTGSLWAPITMHSLFNASTIAALLLRPEAFT